MSISKHDDLKWEGGAFSAYLMPMSLFLAVAFVVLTPSSFAQSQPDLAKPASAAEGTKADEPNQVGSECETAIHAGAFNIDINYPGAGLRYFLSGEMALEGRAQYDKDNLAAGARLYWYPMLLVPDATRGRLRPADSRFSPYLCAEGDYVSFKGSASKGTGFSAGAFAGIEYSLSRSFSLQIDAGGAYISLRDQDTSLTQNGFGFALNFGVNFYIR
jgi:hypothetical protein